MRPLCAAPRSARLTLFERLRTDQYRLRVCEPRPRRATNRRVPGKSISDRTLCLLAERHLTLLVGSAAAFHYGASRFSNAEGWRSIKGLAEDKPSPQQSAVTFSFLHLGSMTANHITQTIAVAPCEGVTHPRLQQQMV